MTDASAALAVLRAEQERSIRLMFACLVILAGLGVVAVVIGAVMLISLRDQSNRTEHVQASKITKLEDQITTDNTAEKQMVAVIVRLANQVRTMGGKPGVVTVTRPTIKSFVEHPQPIDVGVTTTTQSTSSTQPTPLTQPSQSTARITPTTLPTKCEVRAIVQATLPSVTIIARVCADGLGEILIR